jgi:hypothetical protein
MKGLTTFAGGVQLGDARCADRVRAAGGERLAAKSFSMAMERTCKRTA